MQERHKAGEFDGVRNRCASEFASCGVHAVLIDELVNDASGLNARAGD